MNFNYYLSLGPVMEMQAFKSLLCIKDEKVWRSLAAISVRTKRVDVALHCFAKMEDACGAALIDKAQEEPVCRM